MSASRPFTIKHYLLYIGLLLAFGFGIWLILATGSRLYSQRAVPASTAESPPATVGSVPAKAILPSPTPYQSTYAGRMFRDNLRNPLSILLLQLVVIIVAARLVGRHKAHTAILVSHGSIIVPFFLGAALSLLVYRSLAPAKTPFTAFALFMGIAMSITAFPVLARILEDRGMSQTYLGSIALTCAAVDDVTACLVPEPISLAGSEKLRTIQKIH